MFSQYLEKFSALFAFQIHFSNCHLKVNDFIELMTITKSLQILLDNSFKLILALYLFPGFLRVMNVVKTLI